MTNYEKIKAMSAEEMANLSEAEENTVVGNGWTVDVIAHIFKGLKGK